MGDKSFHNIKQLTLHLMRYDKLQCVFCHKESPNEAEFIIHEMIHQDTKKNYTCDFCEKKYKSSSDARLHEYCHNRHEILKQMKKIEINLYNQMMDVSPEIIMQAKNEFILKQQNDRKIKIQQEESLKKAAKEVKKTRKEKHLNKSEEILNAEKKEIDQAIKEPRREAKEDDIKTEKEDLNSKMAHEESWKKDGKSKKRRHLNKNTDKKEIDLALKESIIEKKIEADEKDPEFKKAIEKSIKEDKKKKKAEEEDPEYKKALEESIKEDK